MTLPEILVEMVDEDVGLGDKKNEVLKSISSALEFNHFKYIEQNGSPIGFFTWEEKGNKIFINNLWIEEGFRDKDNLLFMRDFFRKMYPNKIGYWRNRKFKRMVRYD